MEHSDPVLAHFDFPLRVQLYPLGFPMELTSNAESVIAAARESWGRFVQAFDKPPVQLSIGVREGAGTTEPAPPQYRSREHLLTMILDPDNFVVCDMGSGVSFGWLTERLMTNPQLARYYFLDAAAFAMIEQRYLAPIHGALVAKGEHGVLLCGNTFAGKSTLAYACARQGWTLVCDDASFLVRDREDCYAIGNPHGIRLRQEARQMFPELEGILPSERPNGKVALEIPTCQLDISIAPGAIVKHVVFLNRFSQCPARLVPVGPDFAMQRFATADCYGTVETRQARRNACARLLAVPLLQLEYACLESAIERLEELVGSD